MQPLSSSTITSIRGWRLAAKPRLRPKSFTDYESLLRLYVRARPLGSIAQYDIQVLYAGMIERGLSATTVEYTNAVLQSAFR